MAGLALVGILALPIAASAAVITAGSPIPVGDFPYAVSFSPDSAVALVALADTNSLAVVDTATGVVTSNILVGAGPLSVEFSPDGSLAYTADQVSNTVTPVEMPSQATRMPISVASPQSIVFNPAGTTAYVTSSTTNSVVPITVATGIAGTAIPGGSQPTGIAINPSGTLLFVANSNSGTVTVINTTSSTVVATIAVVGTPVGLGVSPDGREVWVVSTGGRVSIIRVATATVEAELPVAGFPLSVSFSPDGSVALVSRYLEDSVSVIDTDSRTWSNVAVGSYPVFVEFAPSGGFAYVANNSGMDLSVLNFAPALAAGAPASVIVTPTSGLVTTEGGGTDTFIVTLSEAPTDDVTIALSSSDTSEGTTAAAAVLTAANWSTGVTVTVTGVDDATADGPVAYSIVTAAATSPDPLFDGRDVDDVSLTNTDDETAAVTVTPTTGLVTSDAGSSAAFSVVLDSQPTATVVIGLTSSDPTEGTVQANVTFTTANWNVPQFVAVTGVDDATVDGTVAYAVITAAPASADAFYAAINPADVSVSNLDNDVVAPAAPAALRG